MKVGTDGVLLGAWAAGGQRILDIGTGTGVIALMMAQRFPDAQVSAIELDASAAQQAKENVAASPFSDRIAVEHVALQQYETLPFDAIVVNPPFLPMPLLPRVAQELWHGRPTVSPFATSVVEAAVCWPRVG